MPGAASSGASRKSLANFRDGTIWGLKKITVDTGPVGSVFGEHSFYRETWGSRRGGRHVANRSSDPPRSLPEVKVQVRDLVRVVGIVAPFATWVVDTRGKLFLPNPKW